MSQELDLYGSGINWRKAIAIGTVMSVLVAVSGFFGYRWLTSSTEVTADKAVELFRAESAGAESSTGDAGKKAKKTQTKSKDQKKSSAPADESSGSGGGGSSPKNDKTAVAAGTESQPSSGEQSAAAKKAGYDYPTTPEEGVYSWDTEGWEEAAGIRRQFPKESQRIITESDGDSFKSHHYFSEEREIWSEFVISNKGAHLAMQRNRAKFGPVTNDSTIDFAPPMLVGLANPKEGASWSGSWKGRTSGTYRSHIFEHTTMNIGGEQVEVWGYEVQMTMRGELNGTVFAQVRFAPEYALTVQEHYKQEIQTDRGRYRAEWTMTLKSTTPQR